MTPDAFVAELRAAMALLNRGRAAEARPRLEALTRARPEQPDPYALLGLAADQLGDPAAGEALLRRAIALAPDKAQYLFELGRLLARAGRPEPAVEAYRQHLRLTPGHAAARHNLGAALLDAGAADEALAELRAAVAGGHDTPETWLVLARALEDTGDYAAAEAAYRAVLTRRPTDVSAHRDLAQLVWRRTQDIGAAAETLDRALAQPQASADLILLRAKLAEYAGDLTGALATAESALAARPNDAVLLAASAQLGLATDPDTALQRARRAASILPADAGVIATLAQAQLAAGEASAAAATARALLSRAPDDQLALALLTSAQRLSGDPAYDAIRESDLVRSYRLKPPTGWRDVPSFLADLAAALAARHDLAGHPIGQSTRQGGEAALNPRHDRDPVLRAFFEAVRAPIARHLTELGPGTDPFRARNLGGGFRISGAWSVRLRPNGFHTNHVHPRGWISSAFYVSLPRALGAGEGERDERAGWLQFGEPGPPTRPPLGPVRYICPEPGLLALFPSYFWHGTIPFGGDEPRLSIAFDVVPD